jgi:CubicO group peptidase (beta-lactamase class C family)
MPRISRSAAGRRARAVLGCALPLVLLALAPPPRQDGCCEEDPRSVRVDRLFAQWDRDGSPGAAVLVLKDGGVVHRRGYGMANLEHGIRNTPATVFDIASVSKQFAGFAIALLAAEGRLGLDDDVRRHVPELHDFGHTITIRHLLHHTSGLRDWPGTLRMAGWDYGDIISFDQILRMAFDQRELNFVPGDAYAYSNTGYNLLAEVVARVSGSSFREWTERRIFGPLGMRSSHFHDDYDEVVARRAESYRPSGGSFRRNTNNLTALGSSSLFTTVDDLALWALHLEEPVVGGPAVLAQFLTPGLLNSGESTGYGFGINVGEWRGQRRLQHGGSWAGHRSTLTAFPDQRFTVIILSNVSNMNPSALAGEIAAIYLADALAPAPRPVVAAEAAAAAAARPAAQPYGPAEAELREYEGVYRSHELHTEYTLRVRDGELVAWHFRLGERTLRAQRQDAFDGAGFGRIEFLRDGAGRVTGFTANSDRIRNLRFDRLH